MKFYELYNDELGIIVKYKLLSPSDADAMRDSLSGIDRKEYIQEVLARIIYNAYSDVLPILREASKKQSAAIINSLYMGSVMLNPALDIEAWMSASKTAVLEFNESYDEDVIVDVGGIQADGDDARPPMSIEKLPRTKILDVESVLKGKIIGQDEAREIVADCVKGHEAG